MGVAVALCCSSAWGQGANSLALGPLEHFGTWRCVLYGHPSFGDERVLLRFRPGGVAELARPGPDANPPWAPLSPWKVDGQILTFADPRIGREFRADLGRTTLGGTWQTATLIGGWWCSPIASIEIEDDTAVPAASGRSAMPALVAEITATPRYPIEAIRRGLQGRSVVCFLVDAEGNVFAPEIVELSDAIFREPTLEAVTRSKYRPWSDRNEDRPACRTFIFRLDAVR